MACRTCSVDSRQDPSTRRRTDPQPPPSAPIARQPGAARHQPAARRIVTTLGLLLEELLIIDARLAHELRYPFELGPERERARRNGPRCLPHVRILHRHL